MTRQGGSGAAWTRVRKLLTDRANSAVFEYETQPDSLSPRESFDAQLSEYFERNQIRNGCVLVGHSLECFHVRDAAERLTGIVVGIVLVDGRRSGWASSLESIILESAADWAESATVLRQLDDVRPIYESGAETGHHGSLPVGVIGSDPATIYAERRKKGIPETIAAAIRLEVEASFIELSSISTNVAVRVATGSGHDVPNEDPELVAAAIMEIIERCRSV